MWTTPSRRRAMVTSSAAGDAMTRNDVTRDQVPEFAQRLALPTGLSVIRRSATTIQIGVDPPRRILIRDAPIGTFELLSRMTGEYPARALADRLAHRHRMPRDSWDGVMRELVATGFLAATVEQVTEPEARGSEPDRVAASRKRRDAVAVVVGSGRVATTIGTLLAAAGVGHVHLDPHRALRPSDVVPGGLALDEVVGLDDGRAKAARRPRPRPDPSAATSADATSGEQPRRAQQPRRADRDALAAMIRRVSPDANVHPPSGYVPPTIVVLATDGPPDQVQAHELVQGHVPHLAVRASEHRGVVGPFVLPGRSSCLHCHDLHRRDADAGWPRVLLAMQQAAPIPPAVLATSVAASSAEQVLQFLDGERVPDSVDGTLEFRLGEWVVRRRSWRLHPACFCHSA
jgi:hypothetical protein